MQKKKSRVPKRTDTNRIDVQELRREEFQMFSLFKAHQQFVVSLVLIFSAVAPRSRTPTVLVPGGVDRNTLEIAGRVSWTLIG